MDENFGILCFISSVEQAGILCDFGSYDGGQHRPWSPLSSPRFILASIVFLSGSGAPVAWSGSGGSHLAQAPLALNRFLQGLVLSIGSAV